MAVDPDLAGRTFVSPAPYEVGREKIAEFCVALGLPLYDDGRTAPPTFPIVVAFPVLTRLMTDPAVGIELRNVVHGDQRFKQRRPVRAGDVLTATLTVESVRSAAGLDRIATRTDVATVDGEAVAVASATLIHRGSGS